MIEQWSIPTWIFLHTLAERISDKFMKENNEEVLNIIKTICFILPCPTCREHATYFIKKIHHNQVKTKEDLKSLLFFFHNKVNKRLGKRVYQNKNLSVYKNRRFDIITLNFLNAFSKKYNSRLLAGFISQNSKRKTETRRIGDWLKKNWKHF